MQLAPISSVGTTKTRKQFFDEARSAVLSSQKIAGQYVKVSEHTGQGTTIDVASASERGGRGTGPGACCTGSICSTLSLVDCNAAGGIYRGQGLPCSPNPCAGGGGTAIGACCFFGGCFVTDLFTCRHGYGVGAFLGPGSVCTSCGTFGDFGSCCMPDGSCTNTNAGGCGGTWQGGANCGSCHCVAGTCVPGEPQGACCANPLAGCAVTTLGGCGGIYFGDGSLCAWVGSCEHAFCDPTSYYCAPTGPHGEVVPPRCCPEADEMCIACWNPDSRSYEACCCHRDAANNVTCLPL